jgi:serine/threonine protein phosphatase PrpC
MLTHFSISQQGRSHVDKGVPCQDSSYSCRLHIDRFDKDVIIAAVADGVGSCMFSADGSSTAIEGFFECVGHNLTQGKNITEFNDENVEKIIRHALSYSLAKVIHLAEEKELPFIEFDTTLTGVVYDGENLWYGHIGDGGIVVLYTDGEYEMLTSRHKGDEASSVFPLRAEDHWQFGKAPKNVASAVLMTDGVLDHCVGPQRFNNRVYYPFLEPALAEVMADDAASEAAMKDWDEYLGGSGNYPVNFRTQVSDDISFAVIQNSEAVKNLPEIVFDSIKWDEDTEKYREEIRKALYGDAKKKEPEQTGENSDGEAAGLVVETGAPESGTAPAKPKDQSENKDETAPEAANESKAPSATAEPAENKDNDAEKKNSEDPPSVVKENVKAFANSALDSMRECFKQIKDAAVKVVKEVKEIGAKENEQSKPETSETPDAPEAQKKAEGESDNANNKQ